MEVDSNWIEQGKMGVWRLKDVIALLVQKGVWIGVDVFGKGLGMCKTLDVNSLLVGDMGSGSTTSHGKRATEIVLRCLNY